MPTDCPALTDWLAEQCVKCAKRLNIDRTGQRAFIRGNLGTGHWMWLQWQRQNEGEQKTGKKENTTENYCRKENPRTCIHLRIWAVCGVWVASSSSSAAADQMQTLYVHCHHFAAVHCFVRQCLGCVAVHCSDCMCLCVCLCVKSLCTKVGIFTICFWHQNCPHIQTLSQWWAKTKRSRKHWMHSATLSDLGLSAFG